MVAGQPQPRRAPGVVMTEPNGCVEPDPTRAGRSRGVGTNGGRHPRFATLVGYRKAGRTRSTPLPSRSPDILGLGDSNHRMRRQRCLRQSPDGVREYRIDRVGCCDLVTGLGNRLPRDWLVHERRRLKPVATSPAPLCPSRCNASDGMVLTRELRGARRRLSSCNSLGDRQD